MKNTFMLYRGLAFVFVLTLGGAVVHAGGGPVVSDGVTVSVPPSFAAFTRQVQTTKAPTGDIETTNWIAKAPSGEAVVVTSSKMPGKILDPQKLINSARASLLQSLNATLESEEPRPGELPSTRVLFRSDAAFFRARLTVVDDRLVQLLFVGRSEEQRAAPAVSGLFDSFSVTALP